jgi:hypothetical protein
MQGTREREGAAESGLGKVLGPLIAICAGLGLWIAIFWMVFALWPRGW